MPRRWCQCLTATTRSHFLCSGIEFGNSASRISTSWRAGRKYDWSATSTSVARSRMPSSEGQVVAANNSGNLERELVKPKGGPTSIGSGLPLSCESSCQRAMTETATAHVNLGRRRQTTQRERQPLKPVALELCGASAVPSNRRRRRT